MSARGFIIGAPQTGSGKTTLTLGLIGALRRLGHRVAPAKVGPDYIDPAFHAAAAGRSSVNLDFWAMRPALVADLVLRAASSSDLLVIEGVMGLYDGAEVAGGGLSGSTADAARMTGLPVILVVNAAGIAQTIGPIVKGLASYDPAVRVAGVILNRVSSERHQRMLTAALDAIGMPVLGAVPRSEIVELQSRHLGLVQASEVGGLTERLEAAADLVAKHVDLNRLLAVAESVLKSAHSLPPCGGELGAGVAQAPDPEPAPSRPSLARVEGVKQHSPSRIRPPGQRIAVAEDDAFRFSYPHLLDGWRLAGAEILPFSALADQPPDPSADAVYLPGGYPELHAGTLAGSERFKAGILALAASGGPIHGECGGYMVLGNGLVDAEGKRHAMLGLLGVETSFAARKLHLGYREVRAPKAFALGDAGEKFRAHEFHYASVLAEQGEPLFETAGLRCHSVTGSFMHLIDRVD